MKQLLILFLFLLPCLAWAQYPSNGNQKITLGEQTTADGLIWRGVAADTTLTAKSDTAAYFVLDTVNINLYTYKASATGRKWRQLGADTASIAYVNTYGTQTVNGAKTFTNALTATRFNPTANTVTGTGMYAPTSTSLGFSTNGVQKMHITEDGRVGVGVIPAVGIGLQMSANSGPSNKVIFITQNNADLPTVNASCALEFGVYSNNGNNFVSSNTGIGELNYLGQANNAVYNAGKIDVIVDSAGNVANNVGHSGTMRFYTKPTNEGTSYERMRINQIGNIGIGLTNPKSKLQIGGFTSGLPASTGSLQRGAFRIANTTNIVLDFGTVAVGQAWLQVSDASNYASNFNLLLNPNGGEALIGYTTDQGAYRLQVNGQIFATNATIATSDIKFKENITPLNKGLEIVNKLKPVTFNFINDTENNFSEYEEVGFIAQDVDRALSTETFSKSIVKAADDSEPTSTMGLATQNLIPILVKAIQEQQALIKALEQRIINLENK
jgi:hypothetical protein